MEHAGLTEAQQRVCRLLMRGHTVSDTADLLGGTCADVSNMLSSAAKRIARCNHLRWKRCVEKIYATTL